MGHEGIQFQKAGFPLADMATLLGPHSGFDYNMGKRLVELVRPDFHGFSPAAVNRPVEVQGDAVPKNGWWVFNLG